MRAEPIREAPVFEALRPKPKNLHKGTSGKLFAVAGSRSFCGAAVMASKGALRCGCGYVTLASTAGVCQAAACHLTAPTYVLLEETANGRIASSGADEILRAAQSYDAMLLGCGLGLDGDTRSLVHRLLEAWEKPLLLDADGINAVEGRISLLQRAPGVLVLTPHEGEMARLMGRTIPWVHENRVRAALELAQESGACVVLKGPHTLVASPQGQLGENTTGNSGLAKAGSGDLLSGMIASFLAQGVPPYQAAACGVYLHGAAADLCARRLSTYCMQPTDLLEDLPQIFLRNGR